MSDKRHGQSSAGPRYRGVDRRSRNAGLVPRPRARHVVWISLLLAAGGSVPVMFLVPLETSTMTLDSYLLVAAGLLWVVAGGTSLVSWRLTGWALQGWLSSAFVVFGVLTLVSAGLSNFGLVPDHFVEALDGLLSTAIAGGMVWKGMTSCEVDTAFRPFTSVSGGIVVGVLALGALNVAWVDALIPQRVDAPLPVAAAHLATAAIWLTVALTAVAVMPRSLGPHSHAPVWLFVIATLMGASAAVGAPSSAWVPTLASAVLEFMAGALALGTQVTRIERLLMIDDRREVRLQRALANSRREVASGHADLEQRFHDLRNAVAGLQAADAVLRAGSQTGLAQRQELADAVTAELARLHSLLEPEYRMQLLDVDVAQVLGPIVAAERALGALVDVRVPESTRVRADADALGRVFQNVLVNARRYAPGTEVVIGAAVHGPFVEISTRDAGPGIPAEERYVVFEPGVRGSTSDGTDGSGLGLAACKGLLRAMGGEIRISTDGVRGCCVVILLPAADGTAVSAPSEVAFEPARSALHPAV